MEACRLPVRMRNAQSVVMGHNVIVGGGVTFDGSTLGGSTPDANVYEYDVIRDYWGIHSIAPIYLPVSPHHLPLTASAGRREGGS